MEGHPCDVWDTLCELASISCISMRLQAVEKLKARGISSEDDVIAVSTWSNILLEAQHPCLQGIKPCEAPHTADGDQAHVSMHLLAASAAVATSLPYRITGARLISVVPAHMCLGLQLTAEDYDLPTVAPRLKELARQVSSGRGFQLIK